MIARWTLEFVELNSSVEHVHFSEGSVSNLGRDLSETAGAAAVIQGFRGRVAKRSDHDLNINAFTGSMQGKQSRQPVSQAHWPQCCGGRLHARPAPIVSAGRHQSQISAPGLASRIFRATSFACSWSRHGIKILFVPVRPFVTAGVPARVTMIARSPTMSGRRARGTEYSLHAEQGPSQVFSNAARCAKGSRGTGLGRYLAARWACHALVSRSG